MKHAYIPYLEDGSGDVLVCVDVDGQPEATETFGFCR